VGLDQIAIVLILPPVSEISEIPKSAKCRKSRICRFAGRQSSSRAWGGGGKGGGGGGRARRLLASRSMTILDVVHLANAAKARPFRDYEAPIVSRPQTRIPFAPADTLGRHPAPEISLIWSGGADPYRQDALAEPAVDNVPLARNLLSHR